MEICSSTAYFKRFYLKAGRCGVLIYLFSEDEKTREPRWKHGFMNMCVCSYVYIRFRIQVDLVYML